GPLRRAVCAGGRHGRARHPRERGPSRTRAADAALAPRAPGRAGMSRWLRIAALELWFAVLVVTAWWVLSANADSLYFPPLETILGADAGEHLRPSLPNLALGYAIASVAGVLGGILIGMNKWASAALDPLVHFFRALPGPALLPFAIIAFGIGTAMKVWIIAF